MTKKIFESFFKNIQDPGIITNGIKGSDGCQNFGFASWDPLI